MKGTSHGRLALLAGPAAAAAALLPAAAVAAPPVGGILPKSPLPAAAAAAAALPVVAAAAAKPTVTPTLRRQWRMTRVVVRVHLRPRTSTTGGGVASCTPDDGWLICRNLPLAGELVNTCYNDELVTIQGSFTQMTKVAVDPLTMTVTTYQRMYWTGVQGIGSLGDSYSAYDSTVELQRVKTFAFGTITHTGRQEAQALISPNPGVADQYIFVKTITNVLVSANGTVSVDVDIQGPGISCFDNTMNCDD
ncbi:MAG TPA: hypothetical protein VFL66_04370 [Gaiellaceae bacterium]|nr:hypothetical protein [Gaiellaceae bacterium]